MIFGGGLWSLILNVSKSASGSGWKFWVFTGWTPFGGKKRVLVLSHYVFLLKNPWYWFHMLLLCSSFLKPTSGRTMKLCTSRLISAGYQKTASAEWSCVLEYFRTEEWRMDVHGTFPKELESRGVSVELMVAFSSFFAINNYYYDYIIIIASCYICSSYHSWIPTSELLKEVNFMRSEKDYHRSSTR